MILSAASTGLGATRLPELAGFVAEVGPGGDGLTAGEEHAANVATAAPTSTMPIEAFIPSALLCVMDDVQFQSVITQGRP
jgi:hypothetical protein